jgi:hypothetical protein
MRRPAEIRAEWNSGWILKGRAIQDVIVEHWRADGAPREVGSTVRLFDPGTKAWHVTYFGAVNLHVVALTARPAGSEIHLDATLKDGTRLRWQFIEIDVEHFHRQGLRAAPGQPLALYEELWAHRSATAS